MRRRLALTTAAIAVLIVVAFLVPLALLVRSLAEDRALSAADRSAATLAPVLTAVSDRDSIRQVVLANQAADVGDVSVFLADDTVLGEPAIIDDDVALARDGRSFSTRADGGVAVLVPVLGPNGETDVVRVFVSDERLHDGVVPAWLVLGALGVLLVLVAVAVADRLGRSVVGPMAELADTADRLGRGDLHARVEPKGPPEVAEVGRTLNQLADRIDGLVTAEREAVADLSHRLRTPITALRLDVDGLADPVERARLGDDVVALTADVDRLIREARARTTETEASTDLAAITRERVTFWAALADEQGRRYATRIPDDPCLVAASADELRAAVDALLNNVFVHTGDQDAFRVDVQQLPDGGAVLVLDDDGPGLDHTDITARGESPAGSTGLGLDIARRTAEASGGRLELSSATSGGTRVEMELGPPRNR